VRQTALVTLFTIYIFLRDAFIFSEIIFFYYKPLSWHRKKIDAGNKFNSSFCLSQIVNSN